MLMNKIPPLLLLFITLNSCVSNAGKVEKIREDGVEVVINHVEPYNVRENRQRFLSMKYSL